MILLRKTLLVSCFRPVATFESTQKSTIHSKASRTKHSEQSPSQGHENPRTFTCQCYNFGCVDKNNHNKQAQSDICKKDNKKCVKSLENVLKVAEVARYLESHSQKNAQTIINILQHKVDMAAAEEIRALGIRGNFLEDGSSLFPVSKKLRREIVEFTRRSVRYDFGMTLSKSDALSRVCDKRHELAHPKIEREEALKIVEDIEKIEEILRD